MSANQPDVTAARRHAVRNYYENSRDGLVQTHLRELVRNSADAFAGAGSKRACLFVIGESNSGKTYTLEQSFKKVPEFQAYENEYGETIRPLLSMYAPTPCNTKTLAIAILSEMGLAVGGKLNEAALWEMLKRQLMQRGIRFLFIDEMSHVLRHNSPTQIRQVQDRLKHLLNNKEWPLHTIYSGVGNLANLLEGDPQLSNRTRVMRFSPLAWPTDKAFLTKCIKEIAAIAELSIAEDLLEDDFLERLLKASRESTGTVIQSVKEACCTAINRNIAELSMKAFAENYARDTGCLPPDNIFIAKNWRQLSPVTALHDLEGRSSESAKPMKGIK